jgi:hypothetical protein
MPPSLFKFATILAQYSPYDEPPAPQPAPPPRRAMSFSDLQQGLRSYQSGETDDTAFRNGILILIACVAVLALIVHLRQRTKNAGPPDSLGRLGLELGRLVRFPFGSRVMLWWVARATQVPFASLLLSSSLFDKCISAWAAMPTFVVVRQWGRARLERLRPILFDDPALADPAAPAPGV